MERSTNKMVVSGILFFDDMLDQQSLENTLSEGLLKFDRFRKKVKKINRFNCWVDDPDFKLENHIAFHPLSAGASFDDFHQQVNLLSEQPLDFNRPLWHIDVFEGVNGGCALVVRIHHCMADGIALVRVLLSMTHPADGSITQPPVQTRQPVNPLIHMMYLAAGLVSAIPHSLKLPDSPSTLKKPLTGKRSTAWSQPFDLEQV
ncbi:MAG: hypothetical protein CSA49_02315, partial [Gammaproteobacteria bacterium]